MEPGFASLVPTQELLTHVNGKIDTSKNLNSSLITNPPLDLAKTLKARLYVIVTITKFHQFLLPFNTFLEFIHLLLPKFSLKSVDY